MVLSPTRAHSGVLAAVDRPPFPPVQKLDSPILFRNLRQTALSRQRDRTSSPSHAVHRKGRIS